MGVNLDEKFQANAGGEYISAWLKGTVGLQKLKMGL